MSSSEQARADAMADAETLRTNAPDWLYSGWLMVANVGFPDVMPAEANAAAHAAFRAVPGLRGE